MNINFLIIFTLLYTLCFSAQAQQGAVVVGLNANELEADGFESDTKLGYQIGGLYYHFLATNFQLRTGGLFVKRNDILRQGNDKNEIEFFHLDIPLTVQYYLHDRLSLFGGLNALININDDCDGACGLDAKSFAYGATIGGNLNILGLVGIDFIYEHGLSEIAKEIDYKTYSINLVHGF